jgi:XapX domain-containing protein
MNNQESPLKTIIVAARERLEMKALLISFVFGLLVGLLYGVIRVKSPAPPIIALVGLLGMVLGEQAGGWFLAKKMPATNVASAYVLGEPEDQQPRPRDSRLVEGRPLPGSGPIEFWEDSGNPAREVALVLCRPCLAPADSSSCALRIDQAKPPDRARRPRTPSNRRLTGLELGRFFERVKHAPRVIDSILRLVNAKA